MKGTAHRFELRKNKYTQEDQSAKSKENIPNVIDNPRKEAIPVNNLKIDFDVIEHPSFSCFADCEMVSKALAFLNIL
ncbi:hypothetical protein EXM63_02280 [Clostridium botulinum]|uniref:Uncharacterized protein n=1 Tax=Clostridium botulinum TaxID=1491 RepID=A0A6M0SXP0_CLOBO|nr:hypothetical protein [Clostridium botulinum]NFI74380.1 hypothetical protein [Clostridium sporogenes]NFP62288.1 hypothetical protein [Clostridium sporogenes]NFU95560.1 hypothetical protein [Clostridium sporogenes]NFV67893.1 hypothetical protein [Clostridium botulinum]